MGGPPSTVRSVGGYQTFMKLKFIKDKEVFADLED